MQWMWIGGVAMCLLLAGCYQVSGGDDLSTVPVTNNPHIVPSQGMRMSSAPI
jgi:hypothetical protein